LDGHITEGRTMRKLTIALCALASPLTIAGCADNYGYGYGSVGLGPVAYNGFYDDFYGPIYDGYWGNDNFFYYRSNARDRAYRRGDRAHFSREAIAGGRHHAFQGTMTPQRGMRTPGFGRGGGHRGGR
jgi:hypothetical protein